jgi:hypothetical protein
MVHFLSSTKLLAPLLPFIKVCYAFLPIFQRHAVAPNRIEQLSCQFSTILHTSLEIELYPLSIKVLPTFQFAPAMKKLFKIATFVAKSDKLPAALAGIRPFSTHWTTNAATYQTLIHFFKNDVFFPQSGSDHAQGNR